MKQFIGKEQTKTVDFMDGELEVRALTVGNVKAIEARTKKMQAKPEKDQDQLDILRFVVRLSVIGAEDLTDKDFDGFPVSELTQLSEKIMGVSPEAPGKE